MEFVEALKRYSDNIDDAHMACVMRQLAQEAGIEEGKLEECRTDVLKGIYEAYMITNDKADTVDTLERAVRKGSKLNSPHSPNSPTSPK